jgi:PAS domain S-box-containing protein
MAANVPEPDDVPAAVTTDDELKAAGLPFPVVGVGASAGGLEAFTEVVSHLAKDAGLAILFVLHLEPHHKSYLAEVLGRASPLPIKEAAAEAMPVEANHIYVIRPNTDMALIDGHLTISPRSVSGQHMPIDHMFRSLAKIQKSAAVAVVLSGGGTDGVLGFRAIKAEGGITFAQHEKTAKHASMPLSAIADGNVDYVLPPREIAEQLLRLTNHPYRREVLVGERPDTGEILGEVVGALRTATGVDFSHYKRTTIQRRIERRMALRNIENVADYLALVRKEPTELQNLYRDFLICVTQFFRDPEAYEALKEKVFPKLVQGRTPDTPIRGNGKLQLVLLGHDVTDLQKIQRRLASILDNAPNAIMTMDRAGVLDTFNRTGEVLFGYATDELVGHNVKRIIPSLETLFTGTMETQGRRKDGSVFPIGCSLSEMQDGQRWFTCIVYDLTQRRELEAQILEATAAEQRRIGQDLHDEVGQELTGLSLLAANLVDSFPDGSSGEAVTAAKLLDGLKRTLRLVRQLSQGLVPLEVGPEGLRSALAELANRTCEVPGVTCTFRFSKRAAAVHGNAVATHLYRIAKEAVANALRHGKAKNIRISLTLVANASCLRIQDDGCGLKDSNGQGMGIRIMRHRADLIRGKLTVRRGPRGGTVVVCMFPEGGVKWEG